MRSKSRRGGRRTIAHAASVIALLALLGGGCQSGGPAPGRAGSGGATLASQLVRDENGAEDRTEFWYQLARAPVATNDDAFHALLLYLDGNDPAADYAGRVGMLKQRRMLAANFDEPAAAPVQRGTLAAALVGPLGI